MSFIFGSSAVVLLALVLVLVFLVRRIVDAGRNLPVTAEWIDELSLEHYRPMLRLLDGADFKFLRVQPGFTPQVAAQLRQQRCRIFRGYLRSLSHDFGRLCGAIKMLMMYSTHDRPDLAAALIRYQVLFACGLLAINFRLVFYRFGFSGGGGIQLVRLFDMTRLELRTLVPASVSRST